MRWPILVSLIATCGCATMLNPYQPGSRTSPEIIESWGCEWGAVMAKAEELKAELELGKNWIPRVGWDACEVLAAVGAPTSVDWQETASGRSATWWYQVDVDAHMLSLDRTPSGWIVSYVGW